MNKVDRRSVVGALVTAGATVGTADLASALPPEVPLRDLARPVGRVAGDVSFPSDGYVSRDHATLTVGDKRLSFRDLGSANGTFVRVRGEARIREGDLLLVGEQILRIGAGS